MEELQGSREEGCFLFVSVNVNGFACLFRFLMVLIVKVGSHWSLLERSKR